jgi:hypothetical protein
MDQHTQLKIEFFELCRQLNKSNLNINQKTEISFFIEKEQGKLVLYATTNKAYKIQLISKNGLEQWRPCGYLGFLVLEKNLSSWANNHVFEKVQQHNLTQLIKSFIFQYFKEL